jgi:hypothetical protein
MLAKTFKENEEWKATYVVPDSLSQQYRNWISSHDLKQGIIFQRQQVFKATEVISEQVYNLFNAPPGTQFKLLCKIFC